MVSGNKVSQPIVKKTRRGGCADLRRIGEKLHLQVQRKSVYVCVSWCKV
jgi:hypothetical protein